LFEVSVWIGKKGAANMHNTGSRSSGYVFAALLGAIGGGLAVGVITKAIPRMMSQMMAGMMRNMMAQMGGGACDPGEM